MAGLIERLRLRFALWLWPEGPQLVSTIENVAMRAQDAAMQSTRTKVAAAALGADLQFQAGALVDLRDDVERLKADLEMLDARSVAR